MLVKEQNQVYTSDASSLNGHEFISLPETQIEDFGVGLELESFICTDNKQAFVSFLKTQKFDPCSHSYYDFKTRLLKLLCFRRAIGCTTALLNGETGLGTVDLNIGLPDDTLGFGVYPTPLQLAAKMLCYGLTELFIEQGADPCDNDIECRGSISKLPLNLALDALCDHKIVKNFPAGESVYKLFSLFRLPELKEPLDTIKLLASRTKQVMLLGVCCVEEWNLFKLAVLLIVAWDKLVIDGDIYSSPITKLIGLQHGLESDLEKKQVARSMLQAIKLVCYFHKENCTISIAEHEVVPLEVANKFPTEVKLHDKGTQMVSADLDRLAAELFRRNKDLLETAFAEKNSSKASSFRNLSSTYDLHRWAPLLRLGDKVLLETRLMKKMSSKLMYTERICYCPWDPERHIEEVWDDSFCDRLSRAMYHDDRYEFVKVVNGLKSLGSVDCEKTLPEIVIEFMFQYDSANCAAAVLAGETNAFLNFRDLIDVGGSLLHKAAEFGDPKLTALFLENGLLADDGRDCDKLKTKAASPLAVALESIRDNFYLQDWKDKKSAIDLVVLLCHEIFRDKLETIRLLLKTTIVYDEFLLYFKERKMVELCALLMVAHKEILTSDFIVDTLVSSLTIHKAGNVRHMRHFSTSTRHGNSLEDGDPLERNGTLVLLDIFRKMGNYLSAYIRLEPIQGPLHRVSEVAWLLVRQGISEAPVPKIDNTSISRMYLTDNKRALGRVNCYSVEHDCGPKSSYQRNSQLPWLMARAGISGAPVTKMANTSISRMLLADNRRVLGRVNYYSVEQDSGPKLLGRRRYLKQVAMKMSWTLGTSSSTVFARPLHTPVPVSAKRLVDVLRPQQPPMCSSILAALTSGFRRM